MSRSSPFFIVYWALAALLLPAAAGLTWLIGFGLLGLNFSPMALACWALLVVLYVAVVSLLVHHDALRRGLDPWLWATVAAFIPYFVGVVLYLVRRTNGTNLCRACGRSRPPDLPACPHCGSTDELSCPGCGRAVASDWNVCPMCGRDLS